MWNTNSLVYDLNLSLQFPFSTMITNTSLGLPFIYIYIHTHIHTHKCISEKHTLCVYVWIHTDIFLFLKLYGEFSSCVSTLSYYVHPYRPIICLPSKYYLPSSYLSTDNYQFHLPFYRNQFSLTIICQGT